MSKALLDSLQNNSQTPAVTQKILYRNIYIEYFIEINLKYLYL